MASQPVESQFGRLVIHRNGYSIEHRKVSGQEVLCLVEVGGHDYPASYNSDPPPTVYDVYNPMSDSPKWDTRELYLRLADLPPWDGPAVVAFAKDFGALGPTIPAVEPLAEWTWAAERIKEAVWVWEQIRDDGIGEELRARLRPIRNKGKLTGWTYERPTPERIRVKFPDSFKGFRSGTRIFADPDVTFQERDYRKPANHLLGQLIRAGLADRTNTFPVYDPTFGRPVMRTIPESLIGAAWLRLGNAVGGGHAVRVCRQCGKWFAIGDRREHRRVFCSDACKMKHYRQNPPTTTKRAKR